MFFPFVIHTALTVAAACVVLWSASCPIPTTLPCWVLSTIVPLTLSYVFLGTNAVKAGSRAHTASRGRWLCWAPFPVIAIAVAVLLIARVPFRVAFALSRTDLEDEAKRILTSPADPAAQWGEVERRLFRRRIGAYEVGGVDIDRRRGHVFFFIGTGIRGMGLVYLHDPNVPYDDAASDRDLPPNWQRFAYP